MTKQRNPIRNWIGWERGRRRLCVSTKTTTITDGLKPKDFQLLLLSLQILLKFSSIFFPISSQVLPIWSSIPILISISISISCIHRSTTDCIGDSSSSLFFFLGFRFADLQSPTGKRVFRRSSTRSRRKIHVFRRYLTSPAPGSRFACDFSYGKLDGRARNQWLADRSWLGNEYRDLWHPQSRSRVLVDFLFVNFWYFIFILNLRNWLFNEWIEVFVFSLFIILVGIGLDFLDF